MAKNHLNRASVVGWVAKDPKTTFGRTGGANSVALTVANSSYFKDKKTKELKSRTSWISVFIVSKSIATFAVDHISKGQKVFVEGRLETSRWTDDDGVSRSATNIIVSNYNSTLELIGTHQPDDKPTVSDEDDEDDIDF